MRSLKKLLEKQTSLLKTISKPSAEEEEVSPTRNEKNRGNTMPETTIWLKKIKKSLKTYTLQILVLIPKLIIFMYYFV